MLLDFAFGSWTVTSIYNSFMPDARLLAYIYTPANLMPMLV